LVLGVVNVSDGGTTVRAGSSIDSVVSSGMRIVPDVVGMTEADANSAITAVALVVGAITYEYSHTVAAGLVIRQDPLSGTTVPVGSSVDLVVSLGQPVVPYVVGMSEAEARLAIEAAGFAVGKVDYEYSDTVAAGIVLDQEPAGGEIVPTVLAVDLVVSLGPPCVIPDLVCRTDLRRAITEIEVIECLIVGSVTYDYNDTWPPGHIIRQNPVGGTTVSIGSTVDLVVSLGPACVVPDLVCRTDLAEAVAEINAIECLGGLCGTVIYEYNDIWPPGHVIDQYPPGGTIVTWGTCLELVVSFGPPAMVPDVVGMTEANARSAIEGAGLTVGEVEDEYSDTVAAGIVLDQDPGGGTTIPVGWPVDLVVSIGMPVVPDVVGMTEADAVIAITAVDHLTVGTRISGCSLTVPAGYVIGQDPVGGTAVPVGCTVDIEVVMVTGHLVPDAVGFSQADAEQALTAAQCEVSVSTAYSDTIPEGVVISQDPEAATEFCPPLAVNIVVSLGWPAVAVDIDIKPGSCPNPFNVGSRGVLPVAILGTEDADVNTIDPASIRLAAVAPLRSSLEDVAAPVADANECEPNTTGPDGYMDLTVKFKTQQIVGELLYAHGEPVAGQALLLTLTGVLHDGTPIEGSDWVLVLGKVPRSMAAKSSDVNADGVVNILDFAMMAKYWLESAVIGD
jgi:beta-lactam-binding protein with PASTA domain